MLHLSYACPREKRDGIARRSQAHFFNAGFFCFFCAKNKPPACFWLETLAPELVRERKGCKFTFRNHRPNRKRGSKYPLFLFGRSDKIRTCDLLVPNQALYQAEPHPEMTVARARARENARSPSESQMIIAQGNRFVKISEKESLFGIVVRKFSK